ncbi:hypothetical protein QK911_03270 [Lactococcus lactis]
MFLALREIRYNKARYTLIGAIIFLIAYVAILSDTVGLASQFKQAVLIGRPKSRFINKFK